MLLFMIEVLGAEANFSVILEEGMVRNALVVDDSYTMRNMVSLTLKEENFEVATAEDGVDALEVVGDEKFDLAIVDINMPRMDGIELIKQLRNKPNFKYTPILVLTTEGGEDKKMEGKQAGATGWIVKPFNPDTLLSAVHKVCGQG